MFHSYENIALFFTECEVTACDEFGRQLFYSEQHNLMTRVTSRGATGLFSEDKFSPTPAFSLGEKSGQQIHFI